jgi:hypothetical protein
MLGQFGDGNAANAASGGPSSSRNHAAVFDTGLTLGLLGKGDVATKFAIALGGMAAAGACTTGDAFAFDTVAVKEGLATTAAVVRAD